MEKKIGSDTLPTGLTVDGVVHRDFELRRVTLDDNIEAIDEVGSANELKLSKAITARQLVKLGTLTHEQIAMHIGKMFTEDWNVVDAAAAELSKKFAPPKSG